MKTSEALDALRRRITKDARDEDDLLLLKAVQILKRIDDAGGEFHIANVVSYTTGQGLLDVTWGGIPIQIEPVKAREIGWMLLEEASVAESEAAVVRFLKERIGISPEQAGVVLQDFRHWRDDTTSLVGQKAQ